MSIEEPLSIEQVKEVAESHFEQMSKSTNTMIALIATTAMTIMGALEGQRIRTSERIFDLEQRLRVVEQSTKAEA